jgi:hypothetical protein
VPKISVRLRHYSRFLEKQASDYVRSRCVTGCQSDYLDKKMQFDFGLSANLV